MAMPERIWTYPKEPGHEPTWYSQAGSGGTEYIRADMAVLATTHARTVEALREAEKALRRAREDMEAWQAYTSEYMCEKHDAAADIDQIDAALAKIKEAT